MDLAIRKRKTKHQVSYLNFFLANLLYYILDTRK